MTKRFVVIDVDGDHARDADRIKLVEGTPSYEELLAFVESIARATIDGDIVDGMEHLADGNDDEIDTFYATVRDARRLLSLDDPKLI
jgi:hypothetical protein